MSERKKMPLAMQILIALVLAIIAGLLMQGCVDIADTYIKPIGTIFLNLVKFIVVPIVLFSIMSGIISMRDIRKVGSIGLKSVVYYLCTTAIAVILGMLTGSLFKGLFPQLDTSELTYEAADPTPIMDVVVNIFPSNFITPMSSSSMLQIIVMALLIGFGIILVGKEAEPVADGVQRLNLVFMKVMEVILKLSPIGVFCLLTPVVATNGAKVLGSLAMVLLAAYICYIVHMVVTYSISVKLLGKMSPVAFFKAMIPAIVFAFSSASSVGTLPINMECNKKMGVKDEIYSFVLPLGATMFIAACYGINLDFGQMATVVLTATLASIGTAGVPGAGMIMLAMVLASVGLPVDGIALVAGIDRIFDMGRTTVNITGDASAAVVVNNLENRKEARKAA